MTPDNDQPKVTLEQLLRVKRAERPAPEFWAQFDRDLREKQLAAIIEPRPWWAPFIRVGSRLARYQVPIGATAVVALTLLTVRQYEAPPPGAIEPVRTQPAEQAGGGATLAAVEPRGEIAAAGPAAAVPLREREQAPVQVLASKEDSDMQSSSSLGAGALLGGAAETRAEARAADSIASRMVATNLEVVQNSEPELLPLGLHHVSGLQIVSAQSAASYAADGERVEPLAQSGAVVAQRRSSRLLASALPAVASEETAVAAGAVTRSALRLNRSISEERLYDSMRRSGGLSERMAIKF
ncbi:hypothetical protein AXK11_02035 [Cephaloticoccus primus]|uniref:Uncharacterized protein n=2 Tax=Cephaloticoccus primus TaxID=1548207 RepID=A0A139SSR1_9BACT|nr:hypothetical protein AXK11_02035 [Cephaloticoccus primus]